MASDAKDAHRTIPVRPPDWKWLACRPVKKGRVAVNTCGTYGLGSIGYWWARAIAGVVRIIHYSLGPLAPFYLLLFVDDFNMMTAGQSMVKCHLAMLWLLEILGVDMSWKKCRGGVDYGWVGYNVLLKTFRLGLIEQRAAWVLKWITDRLGERVCHIGQFGEALGRLSFAFEALEYEKPFPAPLYTFVALHHNSTRARLPMFVMMVLVWIRSRIERRRTCPCKETRLKTAGALRVDARAEGNDIGIGGWAPAIRADGSVDKYASSWFMIPLTPATAPWAYSKGLPYRTIMSLELFATMTAVALLGPGYLGGGPRSGSVVMPALGDNLTHVVSRGMSTKFPLCLVAMELSARLEAYSARLEASWVPRELNQEADDLSNFRSDGFDPARRVGTLHADSIPLVVIPGMMKAAQAYYDSAAALRASQFPLQQPRTAGKRKRVRLAERDPW